MIPIARIEEKYATLNAVSDLNGFDIECHDDKATTELKYRDEDYLLRIPVSDYIEYVNEWLGIYRAQ